MSTMGCRAQTEAFFCRDSEGIKSQMTGQTVKKRLYTVKKYIVYFVRHYFEG